MKRLIPIGLLGLLGLLLCGAPVVRAQSPSPSASATPVVSHDHGAIMRKVLAKMTLSADEKAKVDRVLNDPSLKGAKRRDAVLAVLTPDNQAKFKTLWAAVHHHHVKPAATPSATSSATPGK